MTGTLYIIGTPIGNLEDITLRALRMLREVDVVLAEDTRHTSKLLSSYEISVSLRRFDSYSRDSDIAWVLRALKEGKKIALVTDAGTPSISDPGSLLLKAVYSHFPTSNVIAIPGPSALTTALSIAGITDSLFTFYGFPPQKKGRQTFFETITLNENTCVFFESPHRIMRSLQELAERTPARLIAVAKELTKMHEQLVRGTCFEVYEYFLQNNDKIKGEFVVIVAPIKQGVTLRD